MHGKRQQKLCEDYVKSGPKNNPFDFYYDFKSNCQQKKLKGKMNLFVWKKSVDIIIV